MLPSLQKATLVALLCASAATAQTAFDSVESLGEALFFDVNLSANRTQSCATCHDPANGFVDARNAMPGQRIFAWR